MSSSAPSPSTAVFVRLRSADAFDPVRLSAVARDSTAWFAGLPGLRSKAFTVSADGREAVNVYLWESEAPARALFGEDFLEAIATAYGVRPQVEYARVVALIDNAAAA